MRDDVVGAEIIRGFVAYCLAPTVHMYPPESYKTRVRERTLEELKEKGINVPEEWGWGDAAPGD